MGIKQVLPLPGPQYSQDYMNGLIRALNAYITQMANPGDTVVNTLQILSVPGSGYALDVGSVWSNNGVLYVVKPNAGYAGSLMGTTALGTVTVVTHP